MASGSADEEVRMWDLRRRPIGSRILRGHQDNVCSVAISGDGHWLASGSGDNSIRLWNLHRPQAPPQVLAGHSDDVFSVAFSPDGQRLASASADKSIRIWDLRYPQELPQVLPQDHRILSLAFSADGETLASGSENGSVRLWRQPAVLARIECRLVWRNLTMDEWRLFIGEGIPYERTCPNLPSGEGAPSDAPVAELSP